VFLIIPEFFSICMSLPFRMLSLWIALRRLNLCSSSARLTCRYDLIRVIGVRTRLQNCEKQLLASSFLPVRLYGTTRLPSDGFQWNMIQYFFVNLWRNFQFHYSLARIMVGVHEDLCTLIIPRWFLLKMRNGADKLCREHQNTRILCFVHRTSLFNLVNKSNSEHSSV